MFFMGKKYKLRVCNGKGFAFSIVFPAGKACFFEKVYHKWRYAMKMMVFAICAGFCYICFSDPGSELSAYWNAKFASHAADTNLVKVNLVKAVIGKRKLTKK